MKKILWIINKPTPEMCDMLNVNPTVYGGWISSLYELFKGANDIELHIATEFKTAELKQCNQDGIYHYVVPTGGDEIVASENSQKEWVTLNRIVNPDVVHIHGTENVFGLNYIIANGANKVVASIQGLVSVYARYYHGGIPYSISSKYTTIIDYLRKTSFKQQEETIKRRGENECRLIQSLDDIIGRTEWDKVHAKTINPQINYHLGNEVLRPSFYKDKWSPENMIPKRIFVSNIRSTVKGGVWAFRIFREVLKSEPEAKLYIAGGADLMNQDKAPFYRKNCLMQILLAELKKIPNYKERVILLNKLSEEDMYQQFIQCNVYLLPSVIENSSNSLGEAQILGVPIVAAYVGGNPEFLENGAAGQLYRLEEYEMAAVKILKFFKNCDLKKSRQLSIQVAEKRHNKQEIYKRLIETYCDIANRI